MPRAKSVPTPVETAKPVGRPRTYEDIYYTTRNRHAVEKAEMKVRHAAELEAASIPRPVSPKAPKTTGSTAGYNIRTGRWKAEQARTGLKLAAAMGLIEVPSEDTVTA